MGDVPPDDLTNSDKLPMNDCEVERKQKTIRIENLRHPGGWHTNVQIQQFLCKCRTFETSFSRDYSTCDKHIKTGFISLEFSTIESAREAFTVLQTLHIDGLKINPIVDPVFFDAATSISPNSYFTPPIDPEVRSCTIYALYLPKGVDENILECIVGNGVIEKFQIIPMPSGLMQAEIVIVNKEAASSIPEDVEDFSIDDGEQNTIVKILTPDDYIKMVDRETAAKPFPVSREKENLSVNGKEEEEDVKVDEIVEETPIVPDIDEDEVLQKIINHVEEERINFAEINEKEELYAICDAVSGHYGGLPDSMLKPVMLNVLQHYLNRTEMHWLRDHIDSLIKVWKTEVLSNAFFERSTVVRMETVHYKPLPDEKKRKNKKSAKQAENSRILMGVGAFLKMNKSRLIVDNKEIGLEEDDDGNTLLEGEALTFESWAKITKSKESGVVAVLDDGTKVVGNGGLTKKQLRMSRAVSGMTDEEYKAWRKEKIANRRSDLKIRIMKKGGVVSNQDDGESRENEENMQPKAKELDEGEIDSEEEKRREANNRKERREQKRKRKTTSSSSSSSDSSDSSESTSSSDGDPKTDSRRRRRKRRKKDRKSTPRGISMHSKISPVFKAMFDNRKAIIAKMSPAHKLAFANVLNKIRQSNAPISRHEATQMMNTMFSGGSGFK